MELPDHSTARDIAGEDLLRECVRCLGSQLDPLEERALCQWWKGQRERAGTLVGALLSRSEAEWTNAIVMHRALRHPFYDKLSDAADAEEFAALLSEDQAFPAFVPLLERALHVLTLVDGRAALPGNVEDEQVPAQHAALMRRLITVIKARVVEDVRLELSQSLIDRTLIFYYGYYCEPWNLIGSLYATEVIGRDRMTKMGAGLERLGLGRADRDVIRVHIVCDEDHARGWMEDVITPSVRANPALRAPIAEGIAACLSTSARNLDDLLRRAMRPRWENRSIFRPWQHLPAATLTAKPDCHLQRPPLN